MKFKKGSLLIAGAFAFSGMSQAIIIDNFNNDSIVSTSGTTPSGISTGVSNGAIILGDERDIAVMNILGTTQTIVRTGLNPPIGDTSREVFLHSQEGLNTGVSFTSYDGADGSFTLLDPVGLRNGGATGVDFSADGDNALRFEVVTASIGAPVFFFAFTDATNFSFFRYEDPGTRLQDPSEAQTVLFSEFTEAGPGVAIPTLLDGGALPFVPTGPFAGGADFTNIGAFGFLVDGSDNFELDFGIDLLETTTVPVPGTILMMLAGGLLVTRRRQTTLS